MASGQRRRFSVFQRCRHPSGARCSAAKLKTCHGALPRRACRLPRQWAQAPLADLHSPAGKQFRPAGHPLYPPPEVSDGLP